MYIYVVKGTKKEKLWFLASDDRTTKNTATFSFRSKHNLQSNLKKKINVMNISACPHLTA